MKGNTDVQFERFLPQFLNAPAFSAVELVSFSNNPFGNGFIEFRGASLPFAVVQSTGNEGIEQFYKVTNYSPNNATDVKFRKNIARAITADKVLYVAGYTRVNGEYVRDPSSTGCTGVESSCLYAPFSFSTPDGGDVSGTSGSAPNVAAALASVLAIFPDTEGVALIRLAKACAIPEQGLSGLGRADFGCMTKMDENGQWRLAGDGVQALIAPNALNQLAFPGTASVSAQSQVQQPSGVQTAG